MGTYKRNVDPLGRIVIPVDIRTQLGIHKGDTVLMSLENGKLILEPENHICRICGASEDVRPEFGICTSCIEKIKCSD